MHKMIVLAGAAMLAACGQSNEAEAPITSETGGMDMMADAVSGEVAANAGTYDITTRDGQTLTQRLNTDNTYTTTQDGTQTETGTWRAVGQQLCFTPQGGSETCYTGSQPGADDGTFTMSGTGGMLDGATVRKTAA